MPSIPVSRDPGRDEDPRPVPGWPEWMDDPAYLAVRAADEDPGDPELGEDPGDGPPPDAGPAELAAEADRVTGELAREAVLLARLGLTGAVAADGCGGGGRAAGPGDAWVRGAGAGDLGQPGGGVRVRDAAGRRARVPGAGLVRGGRCGRG